MSSNNKRLPQIIQDDLRTLWSGTPEARSGKIGYILAWALGIPIPVLLLVFLLRGCN